LPLFLAKDVTDALSKIQTKSGESSETIASFLKAKRQEAFWDRYQIPILVVVTMFICVMIYELSK
jgi:hypothetical protein